MSLYPADKIEMIPPEDYERMLYESLLIKQLPDFFLYQGNEGAQNWLNLDGDASFPVAKQLTQLLLDNINEIISLFPSPINLVSIGIGAGDKEKIILERLLQRGDVPKYYAVDVNSRLVDIAISKVMKLPIYKLGIAGLFEDFNVLQTHWEHPFVFCMLGNNFNNYHPYDFFNTISSYIQKQDRLMIDSHLSSQGEVQTIDNIKNIEQLYNTSANRKFNLHPLLQRGIQQSDCNFSIQLIPVKIMDDTVYRTRKQITIKKDCQVCCGKYKVNMSAGDIIEMGFTYKYKDDQLLNLIEKNGFYPLQYFADMNREHIIIIAQKKE